MRGFALDRLGTLETLDPQGFPQGGNGLAVFNLEARAPYWKNIQFVWFTDAGNVFKEASDIRFDQLRSMVDESAWAQSLAEAMAVTHPGEAAGTAISGAELKQWAMKKGKKLAPALALVRNPDVTLSTYAEESARQAADAALQTNIDSEVANRIADVDAEEAARVADVNAEESDRQAADTG